MTGESGGGGHGATAGVWAAVAVIIAGSIIAGIALIEWIWWLFYTGAGLIVLGCIGAFFAGIMDSVSEFSMPPAAGTPEPDAS